MSVTIGHASIDENGKARGGAAGDQTGKEVCTRSWYAKGWNKVIRPKKASVAEKIAAAMEAACKNNNIGYDQNQRTTLYSQASAKNWNIAAITVKCECDCSSLVAVCVNAAGVKVSKDIYTGNEAAALKNTGEFEILTDSKYLTKDNYLKRGDILLCEGSHTAIALSNGSEATTKPEPASTSSGGDSEKTIWNYLKGKGLNDYAVAGIMGNLYAESGLKATNLQNSYEKKLGMDDKTYTAAVDSGAYGNFVKDSAGYGLAQWTYHTRKKALLDFAKAAKKSIGDLNMQLDFFWKEIQGYSAVMKELKKASSVLAASTAVLTGYEKPADQGLSVQAKRAEYGAKYFEKYATVTNANTSFPAVPFNVTVLISNLNYRSEGSMNGTVKGQTGKGTFTIVQVKNGWGKLKSGAGWIYLENPSYVAIGNTAKSTSTKKEASFSPYTVKVSIDDLNIRSGPGTDTSKLGKCPRGKYTIIDEANGKGATKWGKLKSGAGWISLDYVTRL